MKDTISYMKHMKPSQRCQPSSFELQVVLRLPVAQARAFTFQPVFVPCLYDSDPEDTHAQQPHTCPTFTPGQSSIAQFQCYECTAAYLPRTAELPPRPSSPSLECPVQSTHYRTRKNRENVYLTKSVRHHRESGDLQG